MSDSDPLGIVARIDATAQRLERETRFPFSVCVGPSWLGQPCQRAGWYKFHWSGSEEFPGRLLRVFQRGSNEEGVQVRWITDAGYTLHDRDYKTGRQYAYEDLDGHLFAFADGILEAGGQRYIFECKTHSKKSFSSIVRKGVLDGKPEHYAQCQMYMKLSGLRKALYWAVSKDDDEIYSEVIEYDEGEAERLMEKAKEIVYSPTALPKLASDPEYFACRYCTFRATCHEGVFPPVSCRTCTHSTPVEGRKWRCEKWGEEIPDKQAQLAACEHHVFNPSMVDAYTVLDADEAENSVTYEGEFDGRKIQFKNVGAAQAPDGFTSAELRAMGGNVCSIVSDATVEEVRKKFDASVISN